MRSLLLVLVAASLAALPAAHAQTAAPVLLLQVMAPSAAIDPGNATMLQLRIERSCANPSQVLDPQTAHIAIGPSSPDSEASAWTLTGPAEARFGQQVCATQPSQVVAVQHQAVPGPDADRGKAHTFVVRVKADEASLTTPALPETMISFAIAVTPEPPAPLVIEEPQQEAPGLGWLAPLLGLVVVLALRRRR